jgi:hypothetical protein
MTHLLLQLGTIVLLLAVPMLAPINPVQAAEAKKPARQQEWEKVLATAKKEGQVAIYISGYEEILPEFQKEYPEIKVVPTT